MTTIGCRVHCFCQELRRCQKVRLRLTQAAMTVADGLRAESRMCAPSRRYFRVTTIVSRVREVPSPLEVQHLQRVYPDPKRLMFDLLSPLIDHGMMSEPNIVFSPRLGLCGKLWRAKLHLSWPNKVMVSGVHTTVSGAEENAYLLACDLYKNIGLIQKQDSGQMVVMDQEYVFDVLRRLHTSYNPLAPPPPQFRLVTTLTQPESTQAVMATGGFSSEDKNPCHLWETHVQGAWPLRFDVRETGPTAWISQYAAALKTCMKLKSLGLLTRGNHGLESQSLASLSRTVLAAKHEAFESTDTEDFDPHYEIYSDASRKGFGAYLLTKDDGLVRWLANTWSEHFPDYDGHICWRQKSVMPPGAMQLDSTFFEMYAVVAACYTWKHKFLDQRVRVWTDNYNIAKIVNSGLWSAHSKVRMGKLFHILHHTCSKNRIHLRAAHVHRTENTAADLLSRSQLDAFREVVPDAAPACKKTKKLLFWNPLQTVPFLNEKLFHDSGETILVQSFRGQKIPSRELTKNRKIG